MKFFQDTFWRRMNNFVLEGNRCVEKAVLQLANKKNKKSNEKNRRQERLDQLKLEGELEAVRSYEKYLNKKIQNLKLAKQILGNEGNTI